MFPFGYFLFAVWHLEFGVWRLEFGVHRLEFGVWPLGFFRGSLFSIFLVRISQLRLCPVDQIQCSLWVLYCYTVQGCSWSPADHSYLYQQFFICGVFSYWLAGFALRCNLC